jgi:hypothetical protein
VFLFLFLCVCVCLFVGCSWARENPGEDGLRLDQWLENSEGDGGRIEIEIERSRDQDGDRDLGNRERFLCLSCEFPCFWCGPSLRGEVNGSNPPKHRMNEWMNERKKTRETQRKREKTFLVVVVEFFNVPRLSAYARCLCVVSRWSST